MKTNWNAALQVASLVLAITSLPSLLRADDPDASPDAAAALKAFEAASQPGPEHEKLQPLVGEFNYTCKLWMDPSQPPVETTGTIERKWILGGRFLEENVTGKGIDGKTGFEGRGTIGYDNTEDKYTYNWICNMGTCSSNALGSADKTGQQFVFDTEVFCPLRGEKVKGRDEIHIETSDKQVMKTYQYIDGKEVKVMEFTAVRKK